MRNSDQTLVFNGIRYEIIPWDELENKNLRFQVLQNSRMEINVPYSNIKFYFERYFSLALDTTNLQYNIGNRMGMVSTSEKRRFDMALSIYTVSSDLVPKRLQSLCYPRKGTNKS